MGGALRLAAPPDVSDPPARRNAEARCGDHWGGTGGSFGICRGLGMLGSSLDSLDGRVFYV